MCYVEGFEVSGFEREFGRHIALFHDGGDFSALKDRLITQGATLIAPERETPYDRFFFREPVNGYVFEVIMEGGLPFFLRLRPFRSTWTSKTSAARCRCW